ncbi:NIF-domain-containing protein, partial [Ascobolus immersus RN42]
YVSSAVQRRERLASLFFAASLLGLLGEIIYLGRPWDPQEATAHPTIPSTWSPIPFTQRIKARIDDYIKYFRDPAFEKLLPDPITDPAFQRPYTLVLSLEDLLVHTEWDQKHGWRMAKRPGLDYFLGYLFQYYELVVFTDLPMQTAMPMVQKINEYPGYIMHALFRDSCAYEGGKYVKDLTYLNRDLSKTIMIDTNPPAWSRQPSNAVKLPPWKGDPRDKTLIALLPFLEYVAAMSISDVRPMIESYGDKDLPSEFARREAIARAKFMAEIEEEKKKSKNSIGGFFGSALGTTRSAEGEKWIFDRMREQGQKAYEETQRSLMESKEEIMKEQAEQERQMQEGMR